jgi:peroxiredoxin
MTIFRILLLFTVPMVLAQQPSSPLTDTRSPFLSIPPTAPDELRFGAQLVEFEAKDVSGRTWRSEDLRGKFTVIYIWNTFIARAMDKLPKYASGSIPNVLDLAELQRFRDRAKRAKNIQVLTFCNDYDYMHAHDYMNEKKYDFPVIADWVLTKKLFTTREGHFPEWWLVNPEGRLSNPIRHWGFGQFLFEVERAVARE